MRNFYSKKIENVEKKDLNLINNTVISKIIVSFILE